MSAVGKAKAASPFEQELSLAVNGSRMKFSPPSSERRSAQPPPVTTRCGSPPARRTRASPAVRPVTIPLQVEPASLLFSSVPNEPAA